MNSAVKIITGSFFVLLFALTGSAQSPCGGKPNAGLGINKCVKVTSMLVDACGSPEGANEMFAFTVGNKKINTSSLTVQWSSNPWRGTCQGVLTDTIVARINRTIKGCGKLVQPKNGDIPPGAKVFFFTSTDFIIGSNSFINLDDTAYAVFQCSGTTTGHFANYGTPAGTRTTILKLSGSGGCNDTFTYERTFLKKQNGSTGAEDGAVVYFDINGQASYGNKGCYVPTSPPLKVDAVNNSGDTICASGFAGIEAKLQEASCFVWRSKTGTFQDSMSLTTKFTPNPNLSVCKVELVAWGACGKSLKDSFTIVIRKGKTLAVALDSQFCNPARVRVKSNNWKNVNWSSNGKGSITVINDSNIYYKFNTAQDTGYVWIRAKVNDPCGSVLSDSIRVINKSSGTVKALLDSQWCSPAKVRVKARAAGIAVWSTPNGKGTVTGINDSAAYYTFRNPGDTASVWLKATVTDACGIVRKDSIRVLNKISKTIKVTLDSQWCSPPRVRVKSNNNTAVSWATRNGKGSITAVNDSLVYYNFHVPGDTASVWLAAAVTDACGIVIKDSIRVFNKQSRPFKISLDSQWCKTKLRLKVNSWKSVSWTSSGKGTYTVVNDSTVYYNASSASDTADVIFRAAVSNACGDVLKDSLKISLKSQKNYLSIGNDTSLCKVQNISLLAHTSLPSVSWSHNGSGSLQLTDGLNNRYTPAASDQNVMIWVKSSDVCINLSDTMKLDIVTLSKPSFGLSDSIVCIGSGDINLIPDSHNGLFYGNNVSGKIFKPLSAGTYQVKYVVAKGVCKDSITRNIIVKNRPDASFNTSPGTKLDIDQQFEFESIQKTDLIHEWEAGNAGGTDDNFYFRPGIEGTYTVRHYVTDTSTGCMDTAEISVEVTGEEYIVVPNVFTPNKDSLNETFTVAGTGIVKLDLSVYNRWGQLIYHSGELSAAWDGTYKNTDCPEGTYLYLAECHGVSGKKYNFNGVVTLLR